MASTTYPNNSFPKKPIYTPDNKIIKGQYTAGKEFMTEDRREYIGRYHIYPNGAHYTLNAPSISSVRLIKYSVSKELGNTLNSTYFKLTGKSYDTYVAPKQYRPKPNARDKDIGVIQRYFVQKKNEQNRITEVSYTDYTSLNSSNSRGIDEELYNKVTIEWTISGNQEEVAKANLRAIEFAKSKISRLNEYLHDPLEFYFG